MLQVTHRFEIGAVIIVIAILGESSLVAAAVCARVTDSAGLPLRNAWINVVNLKTNKLYTGQADPNGKACVSKLPDGLYSVEAGLTGFLNVRYYPVRIKYPAVEQLQFRLPFSEITEGLLSQDATVAGTLKTDGDTAVQGANICILELDHHTRVTCTVTNDLGEYAFSLPPGVYVVELQMSSGAVHRSKIDVTTPGSYRNLIGATPTKERDH
jgi:hypothetical protein